MEEHLQTDLLRSSVPNGRLPGLASQRQQLELTETKSTEDQNLREPLEGFDRQFSQGKSYVKKKIDRRRRSTDRSEAALKYQQQKIEHNRFNGRNFDEHAQSAQELMCQMSHCP